MAGPVRAARSLKPNAGPGGGECLATGGAFDYFGDDLVSGGWSRQGINNRSAQMRNFFAFLTKPLGGTHKYLRSSARHPELGIDPVQEVPVPDRLGTRLADHRASWHFRSITGGRSHRAAIIMFWIICGAVAAMIASSKGGSGVLGFIVGLLLGPLGIVAAFFLGGEEQKAAKELEAGIAKKCPRCAELVKPDALVCKHCGHEFEATPAAV